MDFYKDQTKEKQNGIQIYIFANKELDSMENKKKLRYENEHRKASKNCNILFFSMIWLWLFFKYFFREISLFSNSNLNNYR